MKTELLYDSDSHIYRFFANVVSCEKKDGSYDAVLDKTAFFPGGGGQKRDEGKIGSAALTDMYTENGRVHHILDSAVLGEVECVLDYPLRFSRMQNHSGEHLFSGIIHNATGFENVGFHMGSEFMTIDFSGEIDKELIYSCELRANEAIYKNIPVKISYPDENELSRLSYRSKKELSGDIRIVEICGIDVCACCAPHVMNTGEIGIIKVLGFMRHRGGTRIFLTCGSSAFFDYVSKNDSVKKIGELTSSKPEEVLSAVNCLLEQNRTLNHELYEADKKYIDCVLKTAAKSEKSICLYFSGLGYDLLRYAATELLKLTSKAAVALSEKPEGGYAFVCASKTLDLKAVTADLRSALNARGGGKSTMTEGSINASKEDIDSFFYAL